MSKSPKRAAAGLTATLNAAGAPRPFSSSGGHLKSAPTQNHTDHAANEVLDAACALLGIVAGRLIAGHPPAIASAVTSVCGVPSGDAPVHPHAARGFGDLDSTFPSRPCEHHAVKLDYPHD